MNERSKKLAQANANLLNQSDASSQGSQNEVYIGGSEDHTTMVGSGVNASR